MNTKHLFIAALVAAGNEIQASRTAGEGCAVARGSKASEDGLCKDCAYRNELMGTSDTDGWCYIFRNRMDGCRKFCPTPAHLRERSKDADEGRAKRVPSGRLLGPSSE